MLAPFFKRCQFCFGLNTLAVAEIDVVVNQLSRFGKRSKLGAVNMLCLENGGRVFSQSIVI